MKFSIKVTLKKDVLDPQGKVVQQTLQGMGMNTLKSLRQGKYFEIEIEENSENKARSKIEDCLLYTSPSPRDVEESRMPSSA